MQRCSNNYCFVLRFIYQNLGYLISVGAVLSLAFLINMILLLENYKTYIVKQQDNNILEYNEIDLEQLCRLARCKYVITGFNDRNSYHQTYVFVHEEQLLLPLNSLLFFENHSSENAITEHAITPRYNINNVNISKPIKQITEDLYIQGFEMLIRQPSTGFMYAINLKPYLGTTKTVYIWTFIIVYAIVFIYLYILHRRELHKHLIETISAEAILNNQSMIIITENVHHELNTPLDVIDNKIQKINNIISTFFHTSINKNISSNEQERAIFLQIAELYKQVNKDFEFIRLSMDQIYGVLDNMKGFKNMKYSNGNKTVYDIMENACKLMSISSSGFDYNIDENLKNYKLRYDKDIQLKNVDLLNVITNHLKNSLEANATFIDISINSDNPDKFSILISDDGAGIPSEIQNKIFQPNTSSKHDNTYLRGNGMYLNKYIMNSNKGDVSLFSTSAEGTKIQVSFQVTLISKNLKPTH